VPRPPANINASVSRVRRLTKRPDAGFSIDLLLDCLRCTRLCIAQYDSGQHAAAEPIVMFLTALSRRPRDNALLPQTQRRKV
jgi:hypothetical protein